MLYGGLHFLHSVGFQKGNGSCVTEWQQGCPVIAGPKKIIQSVTPYRPIDLVFPLTNEATLLQGLLLRTFKVSLLDRHRQCLQTDIVPH